MYENNNKAVISRISKKSLKVNKMRNIFAVIAIMLTTILFTSLFTIALSEIKSFEYSTMRQTGSCAHGGFQSLTPKEFQALSKSKDIKEYGKSIFISVAENPSLLKRQTEIRYTDDNYAKYTFVKPLIKGKMPKAENEIILDTIVLDMLKLKHELGQKINISYSINGKKYSSKFILSGYYKGDRITRASFACVSKEFADKALKNVDLKLSKANYSMCGYMDMEVMLDNKFDISKKLSRIVLKSKLQNDNIDIGVNYAYIGSYLPNNLRGYIPLIMALLFVMLCGYLIIYNIFYISVVKDIHFYGLLKTIGFTSKQLRKFIIKQATILSIFGVPIGLAIGYLIGAALSPFVINGTTATHIAISASPVIFIGSALFSFLTVFISCIKPGKTASKISPIEAVRYNGMIKSGGKKTKNSVHGGQIYRMAFSNIFRDKKKAIIAIVSLALSIILLNSTYTIMNGFDLNKYVKTFIGTDFTIGDVGLYNRFYFNSTKPSPLTEQICDEISNLAGVKELSRIYNRYSSIPLTKLMERRYSKITNNIWKELKRGFEASLKRKSIVGTIYGADFGIFEMLKPYIVSGEMNKKLLKKGNYIFVSSFSPLYKVGEEISIPDDSNRKSKNFKVMAILKGVPLYLTNGGHIPEGVDIYMSSKDFISLSGKPSIMTALFNVKHRYISYIEKCIKDEIKLIPTLDYRSKAAYVKEYQKTVDGYTYVGYTTSFILAIIGLLNFANVIINSIISRRQEFAALQSIGMTSKMLRRMIAYEGLYYSIFTITAGIAFGIPVSFFGVNALVSKIWYFSYHFTLLPIVCMAPILIIITAVIPLISFKSTNKATIVERLREAE